MNARGNPRYSIGRRGISSQNYRSLGGQFFRFFQSDSLKKGGVMFKAVSQKIKKSLKEIEIMKKTGEVVRRMP